MMLFRRLLCSAAACITLAYMPPALAKSAIQPSSDSSHAKISGEYLAGTHFYRTNSMDEAFRHYDRIGYRQLSGEAGYRYMISAVLTGHIKEAAQAAREGDVNRGRILPALTEMAAALYRDDWGALNAIMNQKTSVIDGQGSNTIGDYTMIPLVRAWYHAASGDYEAGKDVLNSDAAEKFFTGPFLNLQRALLADVSGKHSDATKYYTLLEEEEALPYYYTRLVGNYYEREREAAKATALYRTYRDREKRPYMFQDALTRVDNALIPQASVNNFADGVGIVLLETARVLSAHDMNAEAMLYARLAAYISPDLPDAYLIMAEYHSVSASKDIPKNITDTLARFPDMTLDAALVRASVLTNAKRHKEAAELLKDLTVRYPAYPNLGLAYADILRQQKKYKEAAGHYRRVIKETAADDVTWNMYFAMAICYERMDEWTQAERYLKRALAKVPDQPDVLNYLAYGWLERNMRTEEALKMIQSALKQSPDSPHITDSLGWAYFKMDRVDEAIVLLERAAESLPQDPVINDHLGDAYWHQGRKNEAAFQWKRALKYNSENVYDPEELQAKIDFGYSGTATVAAESTAAAPTLP